MVFEEQYELEKQACLDRGGRWQDLSRVETQVLTNESSGKLKLGIGKLGPVTAGSFEGEFASKEQTFVIVYIKAGYCDEDHDGEQSYFEPLLIVKSDPNEVFNFMSWNSPNASQLLVVDPLENMTLKPWGRTGYISITDEFDVSHIVPFTPVVDPATGLIGISNPEMVRMLVEDAIWGRTIIRFEVTVTATFDIHGSFDSTPASDFFQLSYEAPAVTVDTVYPRLQYINWINSTVQ